MSCHACKPWCVCRSACSISSSDAGSPRVFHPCYLVPRCPLPRFQRPLFGAFNEWHAQSGQNLQHRIKNMQLRVMLLRLKLNDVTILCSTVRYLQCVTCCYRVSYQRNYWRFINIIFFTFRISCVTKRLMQDLTVMSLMCAFVCQWRHWSCRGCGQPTGGWWWVCDGAELQWSRKQCVSRHRRVLSSDDTAAKRHNAHSQLIGRIPITTTNRLSSTACSVD